MELVAPLLCWDIVSMKWGHQHDKIHDLTTLYDLAEEYHWTTNLYHTLNVNFDALIITDASQEIQWVSKGFEKMTNYSIGHSIGQRPTFLQGEKTCAATTAEIRESLKVNQVTKANLINYRKSGEEYLCQLQITPLFDGNNHLSHFLAVEKELKLSK